jgi:hypothetical protein
VEGRFFEIIKKNEKTKKQKKREKKNADLALVLIGNKNTINTI